ncbi:MAG TPA: 3-deoxy-8-phosphooctulonate synthase [Phycisphaerales bacterium]|nr:3-deoxy-8-phosphooctulonate synthase [Phycisphaerales bacterium]
MSQPHFTIGPVQVGLDAPLFVMAGPCVIESLDNCLAIAERLVAAAEATDIPFIFKASFDKANRSSIDSFRGPGLHQGLDILHRVREETSLPIMTDVHEPAQATPVAQVVDCLQVPAFLCRQTDLLVACAQTGKPVNVKKGQFLSPAEMKNVVDKLHAAGNNRIMLTERGTFFGYNRLVNDMTAIPTMQALGCPVIFDATHSTQQPGGLGSASAGRPEMAPILARAAVAAGANGLFLEVHTDPPGAKSDAACVLHVDHLKGVITVCKRVFEAVRQPA